MFCPFFLQYTLEESEGVVHLVSEVAGDLTDDSEGEDEDQVHQRCSGTEPLHVLVKKVKPATPNTHIFTHNTHMYVIFTLQVRDRAATSGSRFSLLDALQHGYFSDLTVQSSSGEQVYYTQQQREGVREKSHCIICFVSI